MMHTPPSPGTQPPLITVIVPVFDVQDHVGACIASLRAQTLQDFEVLVIDDGSRDASAARARAAIGEDPRFVLITQDNRGLSGARNTGLDRAGGQFIAFVDSDDRVTPDYLMQLWQALDDSGADWVACAVRSCFADGPSHVHSAIHDAPEIGAHPVPRRYALRDWSDVIRHFPSAWNKLYRRSLIEGLRFDEGTWFEDHGFFYRAAARTDHLLHLPQPLYLQTRGRAGQITTSDDDRVFEQLDVLQDMRAIMAAGPQGGADQAFERIATRLLFERSGALKDPERRARFARASADFLQEQGLKYTPDWDRGIARAWALEMAGILPLSILVPWDGQQPQALQGTLASLADQSGPGREVLLISAADAAQDIAQGHPGTRVIQATGKGLGADWRAGALAARGQYLVCLRPGDLLRPMALQDWVEVMLRTGADSGISQFWQGTGPDALPHNGFDDMRPLPGGTPATGLLSLSPTAALGLSPELSTRIFRREALTGLPGFTDGPRPHWALCLAAPLMGPCAYVGWPGVAVDLSQTGARARQTPRSAGALGRGHDALVRALPDDLAQRLPRGWQRRLFARALRDQVTLGMPPARPAKALLLGGLAWGSLRRGFSGPNRYPAGFDPAFGPRLARLMNPASFARGAPLLPHATGLASTHTSVDTPGQTKAGPVGDHLMYAFPLHGQGLFRFRAEFHGDPFANLSFVAADGVRVPFHLSLRQTEGLVVANDSRADGAWRAERRFARALPVTGAQVVVAITPPHVTVWIDGDQVLRLGRRTPLNRAGLKGLEDIRWLALQGGVRVLDLMPERPKAPLALDPRLQLRSVSAAAGQGLIAAHCGETVPLLPAPDLSGNGVLADLPGRLWRGLETDQPLALTDGSGKTVFSITRQEMAARITTLMATPPGPADSALVLHLLDHLRHGQLHPFLSTDTLGGLQDLADHYGLGDYIAPDTAETRPAAVAPPPEVTDAARIDAALARLAQSQQTDPAPDPLEVVRELTLPPAPQRGLYLALTDVFCREGGDFDGLFELARGAGLPDMDLPDDVWSQSALLPYLVKAGRHDTAAAVLKTLAAPGPGWVLTPPIAWTARRAATDATIPEPAREALLTAYMEFVTARSHSYWDRSHCLELTRAAVTLLLDLGRDDFLGQQVTAFCLRSYGLSRLFWQALAERCPADHPLPPQIRTGQALFAKITAGTDPAQIDRALGFFETAGCTDAARLRVDLLGPAGLPQTTGDAPTLSALVQGSKTPGLAALRHMACPGSAPADPDVSDLVAQSLPELYKPVPQAPYGALQTRAALAISQCLSQPPAPADPAWLETVLTDLARLAGPRSQFLGIGLALCLVPHLRRAGDDASVARIGDWLTARHSALSSDDRQALCRAPALLGPLARLGPDDSALADLFGLPQPDPGPQPEGSALYDTLVVVFSCRPYLDTRIPALQAGWLSLLEALDIPHVVVVGDGDGQRDGHIVHLDAPDDYEGLPQKTLAAIDWVHRNTGFGHMLKIDDDCFLNAPLFFQGLSYKKFDYYGRKLTRGVGQMDRAWHQAKSASARGRYELDRSPEPSFYADGGSGYALSRRAMAAALEAARSPEGQRLIQLSFMEDKMLGDLLALRGIHVMDEDYRVSIRRRTFGEAVPVAAWHNSFFPGPTAPLQLIHLDTHLDQQKALDLLDKPGLYPPKIWPSFQASKLGYQSNALELLSPLETVDRARAAEVAVVAVMRNEMFMLPHFLSHYRKLGVDSFLIADNASDDGTREYLLDQPDVALFSVDTDYKLSHYGVAWQQAMMAAFRPGKWSLVADADELLVWQENQTQTLPDLLKSSDFDGAEAVRIFMLDMYPKGPLEQVDFSSGNPFAEAGYCDAIPFLTNTPARGPYSDRPTWTSALRHRLIPGSRGTLFVAQKLALLRYHPFMRLSDGLHFVGDVKLADRELLFAHFKYNAAFREKARTEVSRRQHFNDAEEYRKYLALASEGRSVIHEDDLSVPWRDCDFVKARLS
ncbi:glycosyltransferase [Tropicibacter oceani]|uniref:Glycosyltransferase n=1 Tax=Tropicibacter oceani TaxID=3058420 RepID=A0ABY8QN40_9RHOB|nr:glycosyltransferase [Tropicibacter oceani]WGW06049.1 glycosyltransferase [Tropicibacter oceani]